METIVKAKDQQAAEANKNASILLKELDLEKVMLSLVLELESFTIASKCNSCWENESDCWGHVTL